jgi:hypothetical protein
MGKKENPRSRGNGQGRRVGLLSWYHDIECFYVIELPKGHISRPSARSLRASPTTVNVD